MAHHYNIVNTNSDENENSFLMGMEAPIDWNITRYKKLNNSVEMTNSTCANMNDITVTQLTDNTEFRREVQVGKCGVHANNKKML